MDLKTLPLGLKTLEAKASASNKAEPANPLSYPKSALPFSKELFTNPTSEYRGCPFWAWNNKLDKEQLLRQIDNFEAMGMGGFHMHVRTGLDTEYMGEEFMDMIRSCVKYAESKKMLACLYDEDRWPSGAAGGKVIEHNPEFKAKHVLFTPHKYGEIDLNDDHNPASRPAPCRQTRHLLATYDVTLDENGSLKSSRKLVKGDLGKNVWYAYLSTNGQDPWYNGQTYVDTLNEDAMAYFIKITHEVYKSKVGDKFGSVVPCIFTDEPQFERKTQLSNPWASTDVALPWTADLAQTFRKQYSSDLIEALPELVWNLPEGKPSVARWRYHDHVCERFVTAHMDQTGKWCQDNNIILDGHMMEEPTLHSQTTALGEAMRCYRSMGMPGMDLLVDRVEYNTAKQASSVARQNGIRGTMSEIYGVTHWYFTFEGHKGCGDWQAALGITFRVHHLTWVSMAGEGKRDYPACIGYQSPWYKEYRYVEDHFARVGVAMTRGEAVTRVGVIHPIESYWLSFGPNGGEEMPTRDRAFEDLTTWLLHGLIDFDFISESLLPGQYKKPPKGKLSVGHCKYDVIILPNLRTIRSSTLKILRKFAKNGGTVIIIGSTPDLVDAQVPQSPPIIERSKNVFWSKHSILDALEEFRELRILTNGGPPTDNLLYQMRQDDYERFVFICNTDRNSATETTIKLKGTWVVRMLDTFTGDESCLLSNASDGWTIFSYKFEGCASLLLRLSPSTEIVHRTLDLDQLSSDFNQPNKDTASGPEMTLDRVSLSEPNVLILDYAEYKLDDEDWNPINEVLKIDNIFRTRLQLPLKGSAWKQPWAISPSERTSKAVATLRFTFESAFTITEPTQLALEPMERMRININGAEIHRETDATARTWWVDEAIETVPIPWKTIKSGKNELTIVFPFGILTNIERIYLLGIFGVSLRGSCRALLQPLEPEKLIWGDITTQGLPFYAGNVIYNCRLCVPAAEGSSPITLSIPNFSSPVLTVTNRITGKKLGRIAFQPRKLKLGRMGAGVHGIAITAFGNRFNAFGHIHMPEGLDYCSPDFWRSTGQWWTDEYNVKPIGVLECPTVMVTNEAPAEKPTEKVEVEEGWVVVTS